MSTRPELLFLSQVLPYPPDGGVRIRTFHVLEMLSEQFEVDALCFHRRSTRDEGTGVAEGVAALKRIARRVEAFPIPQESSRIRFFRDHVRSLVARRPYTVFTYDSPAFRSRLRSWLANSHYDVVHMDSLDLSRYLPLLTERSVVCGHHNVESELLQRRADTVRSPLRKSYLRLQARLLEREEERWCGRVCLNLTVSERDKRELEERIPAIRCRIVPNGVDVDKFRPADPDTDDPRSEIVFVGGCSWFPNRDALSYFAQDVLPSIRREVSGVRVRWVGRADPDTRRRYRRDHGIEMTGYVEDIRPHVHGAACYVVPLRVGGGSRLKILDAWAMGKAVVSTSQGCEGLDARNGKNILIRDEAETFAEAVRLVLRDRELRCQLGREARRTAVESYSWDVIRGKVRTIYGSMVESEGRRVPSD